VVIGAILPAVNSAPLTADPFRSPLPAAVRETLAPVERVHVEVARFMNREPMKALWTFAQRVYGATLVQLVMRGRIHDTGFEHVTRAWGEGTILFVANHRTYFDMFVVSTLLHRRLPGRKRLFFPVLGQYYYQTLTGMVLNQAFAMWSMFPPLFALPSHAASDAWALDVLTALCRRGPGHVIGIHPEGARNLNDDEYSFLRCQPGTGRIIHAARPIVIPVFVAGMHASVPVQLRRAWREGLPARVRFGAPMDLSAHYALPPKGSTYKGIVDAVMGRVRELSEEDRGERR
jgi:1-acyl-sn-glycerol-3-phosphate acyltransferase